MSWQTTLVQPVSPDRLTLMEVTCQWCPWSEGLFDTTTEDGRTAIRTARAAHVCVAAGEQIERP